MSKVKFFGGAAAQQDLSTGNAPHDQIQIKSNSNEVHKSQSETKVLRSKLKILRKTRGYTLEKLSQLTGISPSYLSRLEAGDRRLNTDLIQRLAQVFDCSPAALLQDDLGAPSSEEGFDGSTAICRRDLPIYKLGPYREVGNIPSEQSSDGGVGSYFYMDNPIDWAYRPVQLEHVPGAFAVYLSKPQFSPVYDEGELLLVHPSKPLTKDCAVMVVKQDDSAILAQFGGWEKDSALLVSYATLVPRVAQVPMQKSDLKAIYRIIGTVEYP